MQGFNQASWKLYNRFTSIGSIHNISAILLMCILFSCEKPYPPTGITEPSFPLPSTKGGLGGQIIKVTNLNADGSGSLSEALQTTGPRIIVFEVGGVIDFDRITLNITEPYVTVAGQTAPSPGITIIKGSIQITTHDVIVQHIMVRPGEANQPKKSGWEPDGINLFGAEAYNVIVDHCSITWAIDENLSASGPQYEGRSGTSHNITFSNNIVAEALSFSSHSEGEHSKGSLIFDNVSKVVIIQNLYAHNADRNPLFKTGSYGVVINNLIYNPSTQAIALDYDLSEYEGSSHDPEPPRLSIIGNVLLAGKDTPFYLAMISGFGEAYIHDNKAYKRNENNMDITKKSVTVVSEMPVIIEDYEILPVDLVENFIIENVGARPWDRDEIDERIVRSVSNGSGHIINSQNDIGGYPDYVSTYRELSIPETDTLGWLQSFILSE